MSRKINEIAAEIRKDWSKVYFGAEPYLDAMESIGSDFEYRKAATAAIRRGDMDAAGVTELVKLAGDNLNSEFDGLELLGMIVYCMQLF